ncbi:TSUP family transporter [Larsenimonas rhizosphaerae]|uniref:TSUP family transporter n=1 Tax=Larsenimonas rhizosphaerae TaxID=2944682 RepID=UPI002034942C|nr:TSUP family transporter [Larsenimonas rhizosphaerae]MCM2130694.1 TSUP family transporter [Larsenimonas rhizosphaerae]
MTFGPELLLLFFMLAMAAGCIDAIAGGGGLILLPFLMATGMPPATAIATNKLGSTAGSLAATVHFVKKKQVDLRLIRFQILTAFVGAALGSGLLLTMHSDVLEQVIPVLLIGFGIYFLMAPRLGEVDQHQRITPFVFGLTAAPLIGFYDGFFGPGTGAFLAIAFVSLMGYNLVKATAHAKVLNFVSNLASLIFFIVFGDLYWSVGIAMLAGQVIGGSIGARLAITKGQKLIRIVMVIVTFSVSVKLLWFS